MSDMVPKYRIAHIGINHPNEEEALDTAKNLCALFDLDPNDETRTHIFAGTLFEVKKNCLKGTYGHIAMQTDDLEAAIENLGKKGIQVKEESIRRTAEGRIKFAYLDLEIAGFAFHLTL